MKMCGFTSCCRVPHLPVALGNVSVPIHRFSCAAASMDPCPVPRFLSSGARDREASTIQFSLFSTGLRNEVARQNLQNGIVRRNTVNSVARLHGTFRSPEPLWNLLVEVRGFPKSPQAWSALSRSIREGLQFAHASPDHISHEGHDRVAGRCCDYCGPTDLVPWLLAVFCHQRWPWRSDCAHAVSTQQVLPCFRQGSRK